MTILTLTQEMLALSRRLEMYRLALLQTVPFVVGMDTARPKAEVETLYHAWESERIAVPPWDADPKDLNDDDFVRAVAKNDMTERDVLAGGVPALNLYRHIVELFAEDARPLPIFKAVHSEDERVITVRIVPHDAQPPYLIGAISLIRSKGFDVTANGQAVPPTTRLGGLLSPTGDDIYEVRSFVAHLMTAISVADRMNKEGQDEYTEWMTNGGEYNGE